MATSYAVLMSHKSLALLARPVVGHGGFQSLLRRLQRGRQGRVLHVSQKDLDALVRACSGPSAGGFQQRFRQIVVDVTVDQFMRHPELLRAELPKRRKRA